MRKAACAIIKDFMGDRNSRYYMALQVSSIDISFLFLAITG